MKETAIHPTTTPVADVQHRSTAAAAVTPDTAAPDPDAPRSGVADAAARLAAFAPLVDDPAAALVKDRERLATLQSSTRAKADDLEREQRELAALAATVAWADGPPPVWEICGRPSAPAGTTPYVSANVSPVRECYRHTMQTPAGLRPFGPGYDYQTHGVIAGVEQFETVTAAAPPAPAIIAEPEVIDPVRLERDQQRIVELQGIIDARNEQAARERREVSELAELKATVATRMLPRQVWAIDPRGVQTPAQGLVQCYRTVAGPSGSCWRHVVRDGANYRPVGPGRDASSGVPTINASAFADAPDEMPPAPPVVLGRTWLPCRGHNQFMAYAASFASNRGGVCWRRLERGSPIGFGFDDGGNPTVNPAEFR